MKVNMLVGASSMKEYFYSTGQSWPADRCTGATTCVALEVIAAALRAPNTEVAIPHDPGHGGETHARRQYLEGVIMTLIHKMELSCMTLDGGKHTLTFNLWSEY